MLTARLRLLFRASNANSVGIEAEPAQSRQEVIASSENYLVPSLTGSDR